MGPIRYPVPPWLSRFQTYAEFWPFYLREHANPATRAIHYAGTLASTAVLVAVDREPELVVAARGTVLRLWPGLVQPLLRREEQARNLEAPFWSLISDYRMCGLFLTGRLSDELMKHQVRAR